MTVMDMTQSHVDSCFNAISRYLADGTHMEVIPSRMNLVTSYRNQELVEEHPYPNECSLLECN